MDFLCKEKIQNKCFSNCVNTFKITAKTSVEFIDFSVYFKVVQGQVLWFWYFVK